MKLILCQWKKLNLLKIQKKYVNLIGSVEIYITTWAEEAGEATELEYSASGIENCTAEKVDVVAKGEVAKNFQIGIFTGMKKYLSSDKCGKCFSLIPALMRRERRSAAKEPIECSKH